MKVQGPSQSAKNEGSPECEQSPSTTLDLGIQFLFEDADSVVLLDDVATANLACFLWLAHYTRILGRKGYLRASTYPLCARF